MSTTKPTTLTERRSKLFHEYQRTFFLFQQTQDFDDAVLAGLAWRAFMDDFLTPEQRDTLNVIKLPNRGAKV